ncbi:MAG: hypothetical protein H0Z24_03395 [Thermosipho sp. (in: Bacteria)]|nr:hypothetical protein [Thermosipho sp. (in: thermotogales)]
MKNRKASGWHKWLLVAIMALMATSQAAIPALAANYDIGDPQSQIDSINGTQSNIDIPYTGDFENEVRRYGTGEESTERIEDDEPTYAEKVISLIIYGIARGIDKGILNESANNAVTIDRLVFNKGQKETMGLTLLGGVSDNTEFDPSRFFYQFYLAMQYIAVGLFLPIGLWIGLYFIRAGENAQKKAELKDKLIKLVTTVVLLTSAPEILELMFKFNGAFVNVFEALAKSFLGGSETAASVMELFRNRAAETKAFIHSAAYLMAVGLNFWLLIVYFIRDITISFLFVLFPIIAIWYPLKKGMVVAWFREMFSNIFTQSIHAVALTGALVLAASVPATASFWQQLYGLTGMMMIIPFTAVVKRFLGIEGSVGAAASLAGLGSLFTLYHLGRGIVGVTSHGAREIGGGVADLLRAETESALAAKGKKTAGLERQLNPVNQAETLGSLEEQKRAARKRILRGAGSLIGGGAGAGVTALATAPFGLRTSMMAGAMGGLVGTKLGESVFNSLDTAGNIAADTIEYARETELFGRAAEAFGIKTNREGKELSRQERLNNYLGLTATKLQGEAREQEIKARKAQKLLGALGLKSLGDYSYAKLTPAQAKLSASQLKELGNAKFFANKDMSFIYTEDGQGNRNIIWSGEGYKELGDSQILQEISFGDGEPELSSVQLERFSEQAEQKVSSLKGKPIYKQALHQEFNRLKQEHIQRIQNLREQTGLPIISASTPLEFVADQEMYGVIEQMKQVEIQGLAQIEPPVSYMKNISGNGFALKGRYATVYMVEDGDQLKVAGIGEGDSSLGENSQVIVGMKYNQGRFYQGENIYATEGIRLTPIDTGNVAPLDKEIFANVNLSDVPKGHQALIKKDPDEEGKLVLIDATSYEIIGRYDIPDGAEVDANATYRITNINGRWVQEKTQTTARDIHVIASARMKQIQQYEDEQIRRFQAEMLDQRLRVMEMQYVKGEADLQVELESAMS